MKTVMTEQSYFGWAGFSRLTLACAIASIWACDLAKDEDEPTGAGTGDSANADSASSAADGESSETGQNGPASGLPNETGGAEGETGALLVDGVECTADTECASGICYVTGGLLRNRCGDCKSDADCEGGGCHIHNGLLVPPVGARCEDGSEGAACQTDEACGEGLKCVDVLDFAGFIFRHCATCATDTDCLEGQICSVTYDIPNVGGGRSCVDPRTVPNGQGCDLAGSGAQACENFCAPGSILGAIPVGICSECILDPTTMESMGCAEGETCTLATVDLLTGGTLVPSTCTPPA